jgi:hypothetical protein
MEDVSFFFAMEYASGECPLRKSQAPTLPGECCPEWREGGEISCEAEPDCHAYQPPIEAVSARFVNVPLFPIRSP